MHTQTKLIKLFLLFEFILLSYNFDVNAQSLKIKLMIPQTFKDCIDLECSSTEYIRGWCHDGINPDSADFRTRDGKVYRVISKDHSTSVYAIADSCKKENLLLSFSNSRKIESIRDSPAFCLIRNDAFLGLGDYYLFPYPLQVPEKLKMFESIWLCQTLSSNRTGSYHGNVFSVLVDPKGECQIGVIDNTKKRHADEIYDGIKYQSEYHVGDTLFLEGKYYKISSIEDNFSSILLMPIHVIPNMENLPFEVFHKISPFLKKNKLLLIDVWGTWCQPCIQALPNLENIRKENVDWLSVLSICQDMPKNKKRASDLFRKDKIKVPLIDNVIPSGNVTEILKIKAYPTYIVVNMRGEIVFKIAGEKMLQQRIETLKKTNLSPDFGL